MCRGAAALDPRSEPQASEGAGRADGVCRGAPALDPRSEPQASEGAGRADGVCRGAAALDPRSEPQASEGAGWREVSVPLPPPGRMAAFQVAGQRLVLCNAGGTPYVLENRCPHAFAYLSEGRLDGFVLECPLHGGKLDVRDGSPAALPIRKPARIFAVRQQGEHIQVETPDA